MTVVDSSQTGQLPTDVYWASVEKERLPDTIRAKASAFRKRLEEDGRIALWQRAERTYYGQDPEGGMANSAAVTFGGEEGENVLIRVNHFRSIVQGILTTAAKERPRFEGRALSTDTEALGQARLATGVIEAYFRTMGLEAIQLDVDRMAVVPAEGFTALRWNTSRGRGTQQKDRPVYLDDGKPKTEMVPQPQEPEIDEFGEPIALPPLLVEQTVMETVPYREGEPDAQAFSPVEVVRDLDAPQRTMTWVLLPYRENVWELAAKYPEHRVALLNLRSAQKWPRSAWNDGAWEPQKPDNEQATVWHLYHMPTDAMPEGRHAIVAGDVVVYDGPMQLEEIPVYECIPEKEMATASGYSPQYDLLALCAAYDAIVDVILSSHDALGTQNIAAPKGATVTPTLIARGLRLIEYTLMADAPNNGKPEPLQLLAISPDSFKLMEILQRLMEVLSGLNSVARGDAPPQFKSGAALALVQSLAVSFNSQLQGEVVRHHERVATGLLKLLQRFAENPRMAEVTGRTKRAALAEWSSEAIKSVSRISVEIASPLMQSAAGKMEVANTLLTNGQVKTPA